MDALTFTNFFDKIKLSEIKEEVICQILGFRV